MKTKNECDPGAFLREGSHAQARHPRQADVRLEREAASAPCSTSIKDSLEILKDDLFMKPDTPILLRILSQTNSSATLQNHNKL